MNNFNDENIKKIIKDGVKEPSIKLTSRQILTRYEAQKETVAKPKSFFSFPTVKVALSFMMTALVIGIFVYLNRDEVLPPLTSDTSDVTSSDPGTSLIDYEPEKIPGGKEGEFVFMSLSATSFTSDSDLSLDLMAFKHGQPGGTSQSTSEEASELEAVLDKTLPLVDDFYALDQGFDYEKENGVYQGQFDSYTTKYIVSETVYILANVDFESDEEESETEIDGELVVGDNAYRYSGETEVDLSDNETDISLKIEYSERSYLEIKSENQGQKQEFFYRFVDENEELFEVKIETFRHGNTMMRYIETKVEMNDNEYEFIIAKSEDIYQIHYRHLMISAYKDELGNYIYSF